MTGTVWHLGRWAALLAPALLAAAPACAQTDDEQLWLQINTNVPLAEHLRVTLEQIARFSDRQDGLYQTGFGALIGYRTSRSVELGFGYRKVGAHNGNPGADEDWLRQQVVAIFGPLTTRFRFDERFSPRDPEAAVRFRPLLRYNLPINHHGLGLFVTHESFLTLNSTSWGQRSGYERMRNIAGLTVQLGREVSADIGYLNQYRFARGSTPAKIDHALSLQLTINLAPLAPPRTHD